MIMSNKGSPIAKFSVVTARRVKDQQSGEWTEVDVSFWDCTAFSKLAENVIESCTKGTLVTVSGYARQETWPDKTTGEKRTAVRVIADDVAVSMKWDKVEVLREQRERVTAGKSRGIDDPPF